MSDMGFMVEGRIYNHPECPHRGNWGMEKFSGVLLRICWTCGTAWALAATDEGRFYWEDIPMEEDAHGDRVGVVVEDVQPVSGDQEEHGVREKSESSGRKGPPVQDLPRPLELDLPAEEG